MSDKISKSNFDMITFDVEFSIVFALHDIVFQIDKERFQVQNLQFSKQRRQFDNDFENVLHKIDNVIEILVLHIFDARIIHQNMNSSNQKFFDDREFR